MEQRPESEFLAHENHPLGEHLRAVALLASQFAAPFGSSDWAELAGLWHDLGKYQPDFQRRLRGEKVSVEHSGAGAAYAMSLHPSVAYPLAFVIAGHHAGLANLERTETGGPRPLSCRIEENRLLAAALAKVIPAALTKTQIPPWPDIVSGSFLSRAERMRRIELWIRFLFSALTDADYLDTEAALAPERSAARVGTPELAPLAERLEQALQEKAQKALPSPVNDIRRRIAESCLHSAQKQPGVFSLTAPTGSGKTLASMRFALHHALRNGLRRVIVVLPYTSIIEQNAAVYRDIFGPATVLEHHSNLDEEARSERDGREATEQHRLASENWDAAIIVTTTVQFLESLFSNRPSRCRKLHNIARSVVLLDEVQSLPPEFLITILDALRTLSRDYGCSILLSTATPPALVARQGFPHGFSQVEEILPNASAVANSLRRVSYHWPTEDRLVAWDELAQQICQHPQALAVVHLRNDAKELAQLVKGLDADAPAFHLSAAMCPAHRSEVLNQVRGLLAAGKPCRLISTQLIEAGVDIDFPVVFRAVAGLDSIVQAAGRCNREGQLDEGDVYLFHAPTQPPPGVLRKGIEAIQLLRAVRGAGLDLADPGICQEYFRVLYSTSVSDTHAIQANRADLNFFTVAREFRLIEDGATATVIAPYGEKARELLLQMEREGPARATLRALQPYTVRVYPRTLQALLDKGAAIELTPGMYFLPGHYENLYDKDFGLLTDGEGLPLLIA
jgi:CRISPR-associated endonuclease/helicase Cas3